MWGRITVSYPDIMPTCGLPVVILDTYLNLPDLRLRDKPSLLAVGYYIKFNLNESNPLNSRRNSQSHARIDECGPLADRP